MNIEQYIIDAAMCVLDSNEEDAFLHPATDEVVAQSGDFGSYIGCKVDKDAAEPHMRSYTDPAQSDRGDMLK